MSLVLDTTNKKIELTLDEAVTTNELTFMTSYADQGVTSFVPGSNDGQSNGTNDVTIVSAPSSNTYRLISSIEIYNNDSETAIITIKLDNNGTERIIYPAQLASGEKLSYTKEIGWEIYSSTGLVKESSAVNAVDVSITDSGGYFSGVNVESALQEIGGALDETYINADGTVSLSANWDIGDGYRIEADEIRARDGDGLKLYDDAGNGIFVEDGGSVLVDSGANSSVFGITSDNTSLSSFDMKNTDSGITWRFGATGDSHPSGGGSWFLYDNTNSRWAIAIQNGTYNKVGLNGVAASSVDASLHIKGVAGAPNLSADTNDIFKIETSTTTELIMGGYGTSPYGVWLQTKQSSNSGSSYPLLLNPLGGNVGMGTNTFDGTAAGVLAIGNGTAPAAGTADQSYLYAKDVSSSSELFGMDEDGNEAQITPHPHDFLASLPIDGREYPWSYSATNYYLGKHIDVDMMGAIRALEELTGKQFIYLSDLSKDEIWDWDADQTRQADERDEAIANVKARKSLLQEKIDSETDKDKKEELQKELDGIDIPKSYQKKRPPKWMIDRGIKSKVKKNKKWKGIKK
jgi:hypothetical protein